MHDNIREFPLLSQGETRERLQVQSLSDFLAAIEEVREDSAQESDNEHEIPHLWFRGQDSVEQPDGSWKLIPKLQRFVSTNDERIYFETESAINNDFQSRASIFFESKPDTSDFTSWLTLMQHYGFPTRLLDWSRSPLYALFFATADRSLDGRDACIWILNPGLLNEYAHLEDKPYLYHMGHNKVKEVLWPAFRVTDYSKDVNAEWRKYADKIVACYALQKDPRVFNQQSVFTVHNSIKTLEDINNEILQDVQYYGKQLLRRIVIPKDKKQSIFNQLYNSGITHSVVFPDLEHVGKDVQRLYGIERDLVTKAKEFGNP